jgi:hypothetical protein
VILADAGIIIGRISEIMGKRAAIIGNWCVEHDNNYLKDGKCEKGGGCWFVIKNHDVT